MSSYKSHNTFNVFLVLPLAAAGIYLYLKPTNLQLFIFIAVFVYGTFFMSPDMDLANKIKWFSLRGLFSIPFKTYSRVFKHRGFSHSLVFGTISRVLWLFGFVALILYLTGAFLAVKAKTLLLYHAHKKEFYYAFFGVFLSDIGHILLDRIKK